MYLTHCGQGPSIHHVHQRTAIGDENTPLWWGNWQLAHTKTRIPGSLNRAKRRSRNRKVVGSIPGAGMSGGGRRQPCVKGILSGEIAK